MSSWRRQAARQLDLATRTVAVPNLVVVNDMKGALEMVLHGLLAKAAPTVVTGAVGVAAYEALRKGVAKVPLRAATVTVTAGACALLARPSARPSRALSRPD